METEADRQIRFVIRILRYIGWPFATLSVGMTILGILLAPFIALSKEGSIGITLVVAVSPIPFVAFFAWLLRVAKRMSQRDVNAKAPATILSALMLLGFPLFTVVGIMCLYKLERYYPTYCTEQEVVR